MKIYDSIIIGAGPSGINASIKLKEKGFNVLLIEKSMPGGKVNIAPLVVNYPKFKEITGPDLAFYFYSLMKDADINFIGEEVISLSKGEYFLVKTNKSEYYSKAVLINSGTKEKKLNLANEDKLLGRGLSYCALCDGHFYKNKVVMVVMGSEHAFSDVKHLCSLCSKVICITSDGEVKIPSKYKDVFDSSNIEIITNASIKNINGEDKLSSVTLSNGEEIKVDGLFPLIGFIPNTEFVNLDILTFDKTIKVDINTMETSVNGCFASGDVINRDIHQIYLAEIDSNKAVTSIEKYLNC